MTSFGNLRRTLLLACAGGMLAPALLLAQSAGGAPGAGNGQGASRGFDLFAIVDFAATGTRPSSNYRFFVTNSGPMDAQARDLGGPARVIRSGTLFTQFNEITLFAAAAPGDQKINRAKVASLGNVTGTGAALSYNYHRDLPGKSHWLAADGSLGFRHSGSRSSANTSSCLSHTPSLGVGVPLMAGSDCPATWGINGFEGRRPVPSAAYLASFNADRPNFRFNFFDVPVALQDTFSFLGDRFQTYGVANDYSRDRLAVFGNVVPGGTGSPREEGYPLGLEWKFDAFTMAAAPGIVFWQATVTNKTGDVYGAANAFDYDSLFAGVLTRHQRLLRSRVGFDPSRGAFVFNEIGHNSNCDLAKAIPGNFASDNFFGDCRAPQVGFTNGTSAVVFLKSPIGDLRYKQFSDPTSPYFFPGSPVAGDTLTYNIGRMCGDDCIADRFATASRGFGTLAAREALALGGDSPSALDALTYWHLFHPANRAAYAGGGPRVDLSNPRAGGGFNYMVPDNWRYNTRPRSAPAAGGDTLFLDGCNPDPAINACVGRWTDSLPDGSLNFTRGATWLGAGPFRLAAGQSAALTLAIIAEPDSTSVERSINQAISLYQGFFVSATPPPPPRVVSVQVTPGSTRVSRIRVLLDNRTVGYTDPFLLQMASRFRTAPANATTPEAKLNRLNKRFIRAAIPNDTGLTLADTLTRLASNQISAIYVYKSCNPGSGEYTKSSSPNFCTNDRVFDSLGVDRGPAAYRVINADSASFIDGTVLAGQTYQYQFVPSSRGVRLQLVTDSTAAGRIMKDTILVPATSALPTLAGAPNSITVYVPASIQAGGATSRVVYTRETGPTTFYGDTLTYNGPFVTALDTLSDTLRYKFVAGDTVLVREYLTNAALDSTQVLVIRSAPTRFNFLRTVATDPLSTYNQPFRARLDTLSLVRKSSARVPLVTSAAIVPTESTPVNGRSVRTYLLGNAGGLINAGSGSFVTTGVVGPIPQGVLLLKQNGAFVPVIVGNDFRSGQFGLNPKVLSSADYAGVAVDVPNRPVFNTFTAANFGGVQRIETFWTDPIGGRFISAANAKPTPDFFAASSRLINTSTGEYIFQYSGADFGPGAPFNLNNGLAGLQSSLDASLKQRPVAQKTDNSPRVINAINASLGSKYTSDSLIVVDLPFKVVNHSYGDRPVIVAMRAADKSISTASGVVDPLHYFRMGSGIDTARVTILPDKWVPGEQLILLEQVQLADTLANGRVAVDANGQIKYRDTLVVTASRALLGCGTTGTFCNPIVGRGGSGYVAPEAGSQLFVRYAVPVSSDRELEFSVTPLMAGARVKTVSRTQMDSIRVVPNPYILYSNYEQSRSEERRVMFTHLPPSGVIRIYTASGQFVQQITWTQAELNGSGDLYFNLLTREGTLMSSGLYLFTVQANSDTGGARKGSTGRFIIIR
jgi:hypothetical protein